MSTVRIYQLIQKANLAMSESEAEELVDEFEKLVYRRFDDRKEHLATKQDLVGSTLEVVKEVNTVKVDLAAMEAKLIKWTIGTGLGVCGIIIAVVKYL